MGTTCFGVLLVLTSIHGTQGHGAVTKPLARKLPSQTYCPWCLGEHNAAENPPGVINHDVVPSSPCMGTSRGGEHYTAQLYGSRYSVVAGDVEGGFHAGHHFEA